MKFENFVFGYFSFTTLYLVYKYFGERLPNALRYKSFFTLPSVSSQDSSVGSASDWYLEGPWFISQHLQLNFKLEKVCRRDSTQYAIKYSYIESNLK